MAELFWFRIGETPDLEAFRYPVAKSWRSLTWKQAGERVRAITCGLRAIGIGNEERCGILSGTRVEWILADLGILCAGAVTTTVYPSSTAEESAFILADSGSRIVFAEDDVQIAKLRERRGEMPEVVKIVTFDGTGDGDWVMTLDELEARGRDFAKENPGVLEEIAASIEPDQLATLIYTSGTTGKPKGVRLVHSCWTYQAEANREMKILSVSDLQYLWMPMSHSFGKVLTAAQVAVGFPTAIDGVIENIVANLAVVKPTFMGAAPRIFEKVYNKVVGSAKAAGGLKYKIFTWAVSVGRKVSRQRQQGKEPSGLLAVQYRLADRLVFSKIKQLFGGRVRFFISGSAPLSKDIAEFFHAAGILILEGYGLTETSAASFINRPEKFRFGTVGIPLPGSHVRIDPADGEILLAGPGVMRGYHNLPEQTTEVLTEDRWLRTGDIGELDAQGFLRITDRKKDLIKTSGGKYVAPQLLEGRFKAICPLVSQIIVHGDRRNFCTALITVDKDAITGWAGQNGLGGVSYGELAKHEQVRAMMQGYVDQLNAELPGYQTVKRFALLPKDLSVEDGELTPSLKVKRKAVEKKYMDVLDDMYEGAINEL